MNAAIKIISYVRDCAGRVLAQLEHPEATVADLVDARRTIAHMRADLDEVDQRIRAKIAARVARPSPFLPPLVTDKEVSDYARRLHAQCTGGAADGAACGPTGPQAASPALPQGTARDGSGAAFAEDVILESISNDRAIEQPLSDEAPSPSPLRNFRPTHRFSPRLGKLLAVSNSLTSPGRRPA